MRNHIKSLISSRVFELSITLIILLNAALVGIELSTDNIVMLMQEAPNAPTYSSDPYGSLDEAMFTLFRTLTGDDWTDLRYNLITAHERGIVQASPAVITMFHVLWFVWSSFLLLNLLVAAIVNNYQLAMDKTTHTKSN